MARTLRARDLSHVNDLTIRQTLSTGAQATVEGNLVPDAADTRDLGSAANPWDNLYVNEIIGFSASSNNPLYWLRESVTKPVNGDFSWVNQGAATITANTDGSLFLFAPAAAAVNFRIRIKSAPATPWTVTAGMVPSLINAAACAIILRESSGGTFINYGLVGPGTESLRIISNDYTNPTTTSGNNFTANFPSLNSLVWLRAADDGTDITFSYSMNRLNFIQVFQESRTTFLASGPDEIGFGSNANDTTYDSGVLLIDWAET